MKKVIFRIIQGTIFVILLFSIMVIAYFLLVDISTNLPEEISGDITIETREFMGRNIYVISSNEENVVSNDLDEDENNISGNISDNINKISENDSIKVDSSNNYILSENIEEDNTLSKEEKVIIYFHGGSYVSEATIDHWKLIEKIVRDTGNTVILPDYPLTPKYTDKDVEKMVTDLYKELVEKYIPEDVEIILIGDSAGGGIALALAQVVEEMGIKRPYETILISPWLDIALDNPKIEEVEELDPQLNKELLQVAGLAYIGVNEKESVWSSPINGDFEGLNKITILTGTYDILNPDVEILERNINSVGGEVEILEYQGATHVWFIENKGDKELIDEGYMDFITAINN